MLLFIIYIKNLNKMCIYVDKIVVSFFATGHDEYDDALASSGRYRGYGSIEIKFCPKCKLCKDIEMFKSLNKNIDYNKLCRRCLNMMNGNKTKPTFYK